MSGGGKTHEEKPKMMKFVVLLAALATLAGCATWDGFKKDVVSGVDAVQEAI